MVPEGRLVEMGSRRRGRERSEQGTRGQPEQLAAGLEDNALGAMLPAVRHWFEQRFAAVSEPQRLGWPVIQRGEHALICAPTGTGKTLAAFLACLDHLWRVPRTQAGVRILYVSPLKALGYDISRNLEEPLEGIHRTAQALGEPLRALSVGVRTGDTPAAERARQARRPPEILITTPESLHLILGSRARETLRTVTHVIIDEIHAVCGNKRGVFLALLLERLEALVGERSFVRIGLSATQRPLEVIARFLGGRRSLRAASGRVRHEVRPVTIVDAGVRKALALRVEKPSFDMEQEGTIWPAIERRLLELIESHRSTIVFLNNRRLVERLTARLNELAEGREAIAPLLDDGPGARERADTLASAGEGAVAPLARAHHGSLAMEVRRETEDALKAGRLRAVVATASLELGIDMGAVELVAQVESPGSVARGLQRVGRAGHALGAASTGVLLAKTAADLLESAALARAMSRGEVEPTRPPSNCLDVLAQQVVACVAVDRWNVAELEELIHRADPFRDLSAEALERVLEMVSGRFQVESLRDLRPRIAWDRLHGTLHPLPGTAQLALTGGGTIPDTGQFPVYLGEGGPRLGELDEEFVLERRIGDLFRFGTNTWRIESIDPQRVVVSSAVGGVAVMPFWRGEGAGRTLPLGREVGTLVRTIVERREDAGLMEWLGREYHLEPGSAQALRGWIMRQAVEFGAAPDDRTVVIETFRDPTGEQGLAILSPWGGRLHHTLKLAVQAHLRERMGIELACLHGDDGVLFRLPRLEEPLDPLRGLTADRAEELIRANLIDTPLFGLRFRQNVGRALLMPRPEPGKRAPLWLQRLRAKDLLQAVRRFDDFPITIETYRECLVDDLDVAGMRWLLEAIARGEIRVVMRQGEEPSPFASELIFQFAQKFLYEWDEPKRSEPGRAVSGVDRGLVDPMLGGALSSLGVHAEVVDRLDHRLRGQSHPPRSSDEMAELLRRVGDLQPDELVGPMAGFLQELERQGRAVRITLARGREPERYVLAEEAALWAGVSAEPVDADAVEQVVGRFLRTRVFVTVADVVARYGVDPGLATELLERLADRAAVLRLAENGRGGDGLMELGRWADRQNWVEARRMTLARERREASAVPPEVYAAWLLEHQGVHPHTRREGAQAVPLVLEQLQGYAATPGGWEGELLPRRIHAYRPSWLDECLGGGAWSWRAGRDRDGAGVLRVAFVRRDFEGLFPAGGEAELDADAMAVMEVLNRQGARFVDELARLCRRDPSVVRRALDALLASGLVTNDRFDPLRPAYQAKRDALEQAAREAAAGPGVRRGLRGARRRAAQWPEARWSSLIPPDPQPAAASMEAHLLGWAEALLARHGVLARETVGVEPWAPAWSALVPVLDQAEWRGELRRGYFVEGLSGIQFALAETVEGLERAAARRLTDEPPVLVAAIDPACAYGSGAPLDIPLLEGGTARLPRLAGNWVILIGGRPILIVEGNGRRLTGLPSASQTDLARAFGCLPELIAPGRRVLKVETYNGRAALGSPAEPLLSAAGLVRDPPGMALYATSGL